MFSDICYSVSINVSPRFVCIVFEEFTVKHEDDSCGSVISWSAGHSPIKRTALVTSAI